MQWVKHNGWSVNGSAVKQIAAMTGVILAVMGTTAAAGELVFYSTHDRAHVLVRSETEFVVDRQGGGIRGMCFAGGGCGGEANEQHEKAQREPQH